MKVNLNFGYDKLHLKQIVILIPKYHTNMVSFLTPILGLYGINVKDFINEFESKTKFINFDVIIPVSVRVSKIKTFEINLKTPYIVPLISNLEGFSITKPSINILSIYKLSLLKSLLQNNFLFNYHKNIYISIRKYVSLIVKGEFDIKVPPRFLIKGKSLNNLMFLKNNLFSILRLKKLSYNLFGVFMVFNNASSYLLNYLKKTLSTYKITIDKVSSKFSSNLCNKIFFSGNVFFISSKSLSSYSIIHREIYSKIFYSNFFPIY
jgi:hypothetical protein